MDTASNNIVLVGMPGAGKSTIGVLLAKQLSMGFVDTDVLIQTEEGCSLQDIVDTVGYMRLREIEERVITGLTCDGHVIATGGSAVYSEKAVQHLRSGAATVFLHVPIGALRRRLSDLATRGIARRPDQSFEDLYEERFQLYAACADITVDCGTLGHDAVLAATCRELLRYRGSPV